MKHCEIFEWQLRRWDPEILGIATEPASTKHGTLYVWAECATVLPANEIYEQYFIELINWFLVKEANAKSIMESAESNWYLVATGNQSQEQHFDTSYNIN